MTLLFVWFLTELEQAEGKEGLGETERLPGGQASHSAVNQGEAAGRAEEQIQNPYMQISPVYQMLFCVCCMIVNAVLQVVMLSDSSTDLNI